MAVGIQRNLLAVTAALSTFNFANSMVGVFVPLILLQNGAELWQVAGFYVVYALVKLVVNFPLALVIQRKGAHVGLAIGFIFAALQVGALRIFDGGGSALWVGIAAACFAFSCGGLYNAQHMHISRVIAETGTSSTLATMDMISQVLGIVAPLLGGLVGAALGSGWLLVLAGAGFAAALIPLPWMGAVDRDHSIEEERLHYRLDGAPRRDVLANFCFNLEAMVGNLVWPMFLAVEIAGFREIGVIGLASGVAAMIAVNMAARRGDKGQSRAVMAEGAAVLSAINILRVFAHGTTVLAGISVGYRAGLSYVQNGWVTNYYNHAGRMGIRYVMSMEIGGDIAYVGFWSAMFVPAVVLGPHSFFVVAFLVGSVTAWGCLLITKQPETVSPGTNLTP